MIFHPASRLISKLYFLDDFLGQANQMILSPFRYLSIAGASLSISARDLTKASTNPELLLLLSPRSVRTSVDSYMASVLSEIPVDVEGYRFHFAA